MVEKELLHHDILREMSGAGLGTSGLILQAQSREEILADKIIALAFRENRLKNRDLWDIAWLVQHGVALPAQLIPVKIRDHQRHPGDFTTLLNERLAKKFPRKAVTPAEKPGLERQTKVLLLGFSIRRQGPSRTPPSFTSSTRRIQQTLFW